MKYTYAGFFSSSLMLFIHASFGQFLLPTLCVRAVSFELIIANGTAIAVGVAHHPVIFITDHEHGQFHAVANLTLSSLETTYPHSPRASWTMAVLCGPLRSHFLHFSFSIFSFLHT